MVIKAGPLRARWAVSWSYHNKLHLRMGEAKALSNVRKHGVAFLLAVTVFRDPRIVAMFNQDHSGSEVRWISTGIAPSGALLVVSYRWAELDATNVFVRNWVSPSLSHSR